jgi:hypothetical protein
MHVPQCAGSDVRSTHDPLHIVVPALHPHTPPVHAMFAPIPHGVPSMAVPLCGHVCMPVMHDVSPVLQTSPPGLHDVPDMHAMQLPLRHTMFVPQLVPSLAAVPVSVQLMLPPMHTVLPTWQGLPGGVGVQGAVFVHGLHAPERQYSFIPHWVPSRAGPIGVQTGPPVAHTTFDCSQALASLQSAPIAHPTHVPPLHTAPASHMIPSIAVPEGEQERTPPSQFSMPVLQGPALHIAPGVQVLPPSASPAAS